MTLYLIAHNARNALNSFYALNTCYSKRQTKSKNKRRFIAQISNTFKSCEKQQKFINSKSRTSLREYEHKAKGLKAISEPARQLKSDFCFYARFATQLQRAFAKSKNEHFSICANICENIDSSCESIHSTHATSIRAKCGRDLPQH